MEELPVKGFGVGGYRSIRNLQMIGPMRQITLLAGRNNTGKSNFLRFLRDEYCDALDSIPPQRPQPGHQRQVRRGLDGGQPYGPSFGHRWEDTPHGGQGSPAFAMLGSVEEAIEHFGPERPSNAPAPVGEDWVREVLLAVDGAANVSHGSGEQLHRWWRWETVVQNQKSKSQYWGSGLSDADWYKNVYASLTDVVGNYPARTRLGATVLRKALAPERPSIPSVEFVGAFRQIRPSARRVKNESEEAQAYIPNTSSGEALIPLLGDLSNPPLEQKEAMLTRWHAFEAFVRGVVGDAGAEIRIPRMENDLLVYMNGREQNVMDLGTGIHEVVILAAAATAASGRLFLLEEPEIHLHPGLQKRLLQYLTTTDNQYVIATHSAHVLDTPGAAVFGIRLEDGWTIAEPAITNPEVVDTIRDLGYRPSDLLQVNAVIWVEGPSDMVYLQHWLALTCPELKEGLHFSIAFFGGSLLAHLSGADGDFDSGAESLVELIRINRSTALIVDSDKSNKDKPLKDDVERVRGEFESSGHGLLWVTDGREVENYVKKDVVREAIRQLHPIITKDKDISVGHDRWACKWKYKVEDEAEFRELNKVDLAYKVVELCPDLERFALAEQLEQRLSRLGNFIRKANEL